MNIIYLFLVKKICIWAVG